MIALGPPAFAAVTIEDLSMRLAGLCGLALAALLTPSFAADMPVLRGSRDPVLAEATYFRWDGFYAGGHVSYTNNRSDFAKGFGGLITGVVDPDPVGNATAIGYGGFAGYNFQWDDAVVGVEGNYTRTNLDVDVFGTLSGVGPMGGTLQLRDLATFRVRAGWAATWFMPYGFAGVAIGHGDILRYLTDSATATTYRDNAFGRYGYGFTVGGGIDVCLMANLFLRAEYEYVYIGTFEGIEISANTVRGGLGLKF